MDNWLLVIVGVIFLVSIVVGYIRGLLKIVISLVSTILTIVLVMFLHPYVGDALVKWTPLDEMIEEKCIEVFMQDIPADITENITENVTENILQGEDIQKVLDLIGNIPKDIQIQKIENAKIPHFLKEILLENNNNAIYQELGVNTFPEYVASYISRMIINLIAFVGTFILVFILVRAFMAVLDILGELPVLGTLNHLGGAVAGLVVATLIVWILFLIITISYSTEIGATCFEMIEKSPILSFLYDKNILIKYILSF